MIQYLTVSFILSTLAQAHREDSHKSPPHPPCLTGQMTDVQTWVDERGNFTRSVDARSAVDVSSRMDPVQALKEKTLYRNSRTAVRYISMAKCKLNRVPSVFELQDREGRKLSSTIEYLTMYGNEFYDLNIGGSHYGVSLNATQAKEKDVDFAFGKPGYTVWAAGFQWVKFTRLKELDLRKCSIQVLDRNIFREMKSLEALYLSENAITFIAHNAFEGLLNLLHLDLSRNTGKIEGETMIMEQRLFQPLRLLKSLDFSYTKIGMINFNSFNSLGRNVERLSLCHTGLTRLRADIFYGTRIKYLDISGNIEVLNTQNCLRGLEKYLKVLYADCIDLKSMDMFFGFRQLEVLRLRTNEINAISTSLAASFTKLQILDLTTNRLSLWYWPLFSQMPSLKLLSLRENNLNMISEYMIEDLANVTYLGIGDNYVVCNCHARELFELAYRNEENLKHELFPTANFTNRNFSYYTAFDEYNHIIKSKTAIWKKVTEDDIEEELEAKGNFQLIDYDPEEYKCLIVAQSRTVPFYSVETCSAMRVIYEEFIDDGWDQIMVLLVIPIVIFPMLIFVYVYRRNVRYFFITVRNSATLSLISRDSTLDDENRIFNYDVFVSYCNDDRNWVLDYLLNHVEKDCNVSVCLHERDFQVGLSILENIVSCMDRSRSIMLIISQQFLASQWCQFEMHLAQHRLLETRREDLILVLLEEIPRRLRPTTLHYLMLTKTYIVWPKNEAEQPVFWRRLKRSLVTHRILSPQNISLA